MFKNNSTHKTKSNSFCNCLSLNFQRGTKFYHLSCHKFQKEKIYVHFDIKKLIMSNE